MCAGKVSWCPVRVQRSGVRSRARRCFCRPETAAAPRRRPRAAPPLPLPPRLWALTVAMRSTALLKEGLAAAEEARELCVPLLPPCGAPPGPASARTRNAARPAAGRAQRDTEELWRRPVAAVGARASMAKGCRVFGGFAESGSLGREGAVRAGGETGNGMHGCKWFCRSDAAGPGRADLSARGGRRAGAMLARFRSAALAPTATHARTHRARPLPHHQMTWGSTSAPPATRIAARGGLRPRSALESHHLPRQTTHTDSLSPLLLAHTQPYTAQDPHEKRYSGRSRFTRTPPRPPPPAPGLSRTSA